MFTGKSVIYFSLASMLLLLALVFQDWQIAILVLPLASMFFLTNAFGLPDRLELELDQRIVPSETFGDEDIQIIVRVRNNGAAPLENLEVEHNLPSDMIPERGANHAYYFMESGQSIEMLMEFKDPGRGHYTIGPLTLRARDSFGLYLSERKLEPETLAVMPRPERIRGTELRPRHVGPWAGMIPSRVSGVGTEFFSLREYAPGDDMKRVNWKATAHANRLIVNEMESERVTDVMVVLDTDVSFYEKSERELFEQGVKAAASMTSLLLRQGNRVGMILQGEERGVVTPGFGKRQERRILYKLAAAKPGAAILPTGYVINLLAKMMLPSRAQVLIISPLLDQTITEGIRQLAAAGYSIIVLTPSLRDPETYSSDAERVAFKIARLERSNVLLAIEQMCTLIDWPVNIPLSRRLKEARKARPEIRV